jgi:hypothetical protein
MLTDIIHTTYLSIPDGKAVQLVDAKKQHKPNFYMIGNGTMNRYNIQSIDLLEEIVTLSKPAIIVLNRIKNAIRYDNQTGEVKLPMSELTSSEQRQFEAGYKELSTRNLAKRTKRSHYMINPHALIPLDYDAALELWDAV